LEPGVRIESADWFTEIELPAPPPVVWDWLNDLGRMALWHEDGLRLEEKSRGDGGRVGVGAVVHCYHGAKSPYVIRVTDWMPFSFLGEEFAAGPGMRVRMIYELEPCGNDRTLLRHGFRLFTPVPGRLRRPLCRKVA